MAGERDALRDWHRLFGLLLTDFFTGLPFTVEVERDLSKQQQFLDVVIVRRGRGRLTLRLPDGFDDLADHNLITFKSHHEALDSWAMKELIGHYVAYRKLVSPARSALLPEGQFRLYAVCARFPENLAGQVPWRQRQAGVYHCQWGTDEVRVVVAGQLAREPHNAPLHLFSASPELVGFGQVAYQRRSETTSQVLKQLFGRFRQEGYAMAYTMEDFKRDFFIEHFHKLSREDQRAVLESISPEKKREVLESMPSDVRREVLKSLPLEERREVLRATLEGLPPEERLAGLSPKQIQQYLDRLTADRAAPQGKQKRKK